MTEAVAGTMAAAVLAYIIVKTINANMGDIDD